jgi:methyl-accepting chemotaxis protein
MGVIMGKIKGIRLTIRTKLIGAFVLILVLMAVLGVSSFTALQGIKNSSNQVVTDAIPIRTAASSLLTDIINEETGVRGYLVTGDKSYLTPYTDGKAQLDKDIATIKKHEAGHPVMKDLVEQQAIPSISLLQSFFDGEVLLVQTGQMDQARQSMNNGKDSMDAFRQVYAKIQQNNDKLTQDASTSISHAVRSSDAIIIVVSLISLLACIAVSILLAASIIRPIMRVTRQLKDISEGDGDLTRQLEVKSNDEVGDLAKYFNKMVDNLRNIMRQVGIGAEQVAASSEELTASAEQTSRSTEHIAVAMQDVSAGSERQVQSVAESSKFIAEMSQGLNQITDNTQQVSDSVIQASEVAAEGSVSIHSVVDQMESINKQILRLSDMIAVLGQRSQEVEEIVSVIRGIAGQTNLLALNAAIEAARAGEHGRGFAVVADEVRKLAEESSKSAQQISDMVQSIQEDTQAAVVSMNGTTEEVRKGMNTVADAGKSFEQIQRAVGKVNGQVQEVSAAVQQISAETELVVQSIATIDEIAASTASGTQNVAAAAQEQLASMEEITSSAVSLSKMAEDLQALVGQFKV